MCLFTCAAVCVCVVRHYSDPHVPSVPGIHSFKGSVCHFVSFRLADCAIDIGINKVDIVICNQNNNLLENVVYKENKIF